MAPAPALRLASYERDGHWAAALGAPGDRLVGAGGGGAPRRPGRRRRLVERARARRPDADRLAALGEAAAALSTSPTRAWPWPTPAWGRRCPIPQKILCVASTTAPMRTKPRSTSRPSRWSSRSSPTSSSGRVRRSSCPTDTARRSTTGRDRRRHRPLARTIAARTTRSMWWRAGCPSTTSAHATCRPDLAVDGRQVADTFGPCSPYLVLDDAMQRRGP